MKPTDKKTLDEVIDFPAHDPYPYLSHPDKYFTGKRTLRFKTIIEMIMGMGGVSQEIFKWFDYAEDTISVSVFVQQRSKIKYEALNFIFKTMINRCDKHLLFNGYQFFAKSVAICIRG